MFEVVSLWRHPTEKSSDMEWELQSEPDVRMLLSRPSHNVTRRMAA